MQLVLDTSIALRIPLTSRRIAKISKSDAGTSTRRSSSPFFLVRPVFYKMPSNDSKSPLADRKIAISAGMGNTAQAILELLLSDGFAGKYKEITAIVMEDEQEVFKEQFKGVGVMVYEKDGKNDLGDIDTMMLIPPSSDVSLSSPSLSHVFASISPN